VDGASGPDIRENIYEKAQDIRAGRVDFGAASNTQHEEFAEDAADKATRAAYIDPSYDLPDDQVPADLQFPPRGIESLEDFEDPNDDPEEAYPIVYVNNSGDKVSAEMVDVDQGGDQLVVDDPDYGVTLVEDINRVVEVL
jgi:hypothetical protein